MEIQSLRAQVAALKERAEKAEGERDWLLRQRNDALAREKATEARADAAGAEMGRALAALDRLRRSEAFAMQMAKSIQAVEAFLASNSKAPT